MPPSPLSSPDQRATERPTAPLQLSLVIPAWNQQESIRQAIQEADLALSRLTADYEILVVDDSSTDGTAGAAESEAAANPRVRLLRHPRKLGHGAALRTGFQAATLAFVAVTDAAGQFDLNQLEYLLPLTRQYDVVCGCRIDRQGSARQRFCSWGYNALARLLLASPVHDIDCALKVFRRDQLQTILPESDDLLANTEMLTRARERGLSVVEVGVRHRRAARRGKVTLADGFGALAALLHFWWSRALFAGRRSAPAPWERWSWAGVLLLVLVAGALLFPNLAYPLLEPDEGRYAEIGREMLTSGDWIRPTLNHRPFYDKPPLLYWLVAASLGLFGTHEWAVRLVPAGAAFLTVLATYAFGRRVAGHRAALLGGLALAMTVGFLQCGRTLLLDSVLTLFVALALFAAHEATRGERFRWPWWLASAVCCALGVLTKGPVALVLLAGPVLACGWLTRGAARPRLRHWLALAGVVVGLAAPWYVAVTLRDPSFASQFFIDHHFKRFLTEDYHASPVWFYLPVLLVGGLPWSVLLPSLLRFLFSRSPGVGTLRFPALGFWLLWAGWCVLFFSLSRGKLPPYILPAVPALALLVGWYLDLVLFSPATARPLHRARTSIPRQTVVLLAAAWLVGNLWAWSGGLVDPWEAHELIESALCVACIIAMAGWGRKLSPRVAWAFCGVLGFALLCETVNEFVPAWSAQRAPLARPEEVAAQLEDGRTGVVCVGDEWGSIPFCLGRDDHLLNGTGRPTREVKEFLSRNARNLLIVKQDVGTAAVAQLIPAGMAAVEVMRSRRAKVFLVRSLPGASPESRRRDSLRVPPVLRTPSGSEQ